MWWDDVELKSSKNQVVRRKVWIAIDRRRRCRSMIVSMVGMPPLATTYLAPNHQRFEGFEALPYLLGRDLELISGGGRALARRQLFGGIGEDYWDLMVVEMMMMRRRRRRSRAIELKVDDRTNDESSSKRHDATIPKLSSCDISSWMAEGKHLIVPINR
jgi:hypothetical protein